MPTHLDTIRKIHALATAYPGLGGMFPKIDKDLEEEAGMDGNLQRLLQAARDLDAAETPAPAPTAHTPEPWISGDHAITGADGATVAYIGSVADGDRIVACVNACAGIDNPAAAIAAARRVLEDLIQSYGECAFGAWRALELLGEE